MGSHKTICLATAPGIVLYVVDKMMQGNEWLHGHSWVFPTLLVAVLMWAVAVFLWKHIRAKAIWIVVVLAIANLFQVGYWLAREGSVLASRAVVFGTPLQSANLGGKGQATPETDMSALSSWRIPVTVSVDLPDAHPRLRVVKKSPDSELTWASRDLAWMNDGQEAWVPTRSLTHGNTYVIPLAYRYAKSEGTRGWYGAVLDPDTLRSYPDRGKRTDHSPLPPAQHVPNGGEYCVVLDVLSNGRTFSSGVFDIRIPPKGDNNTRFTIEMDDWRGTSSYCPQSLLSK